MIGNKSSVGTKDTRTSYPKFEEIQISFLQKSIKPVEKNQNAVNYLKDNDKTAVANFKLTQ